MNVLSALPVTEWMKEIKNWIDSAPTAYYFRLQAPRTFWALRDGKICGSKSYIGEEEFELMDVAPLGGTMQFREKQNPDYAISLSLLDARSAFGADFTAFLTNVLNNRESRDHAAGEKCAQDAKAASEASDYMTINQHNPLWGSW